MVVNCSRRLQEGLEPINLLVEDSYAIPHYKILQDHFWKFGATLQVRRGGSFIHGKPVVCVLST